MWKPISRGGWIAGMTAAMLLVCNCGIAREQAQQDGSVVEQVKSELRGVVILRISEELLERLLARDIQQETSVDRCVLGTHAVGTAYTEGSADVDPKPDKDDAAFRVVVDGTSDSRTVGRNGPAIIRSRTSTTWEVTKVIRFDEGKFVTSPGVIESDTTLTPLGVGTDVRGLRGLLTRRIARKRVGESHAQAQRLAEEHTRERILAQVDESIDDRIAQLNGRIQSRPVLEVLLPMMDSQAVEMSTTSNCIHIAFLGLDAAAGVCPLDRLEPTESELWIHASLIGLPIVELAEPVADIFGWLNDHLPALDLPTIPLPGPDLSDLDELAPISFEVVDDWIVLRSEAATSEEAATPEEAATSEDEE